MLMLFYSNSFYYGGEKFFLILGDAGGSDQIQKSQLAGLKVQRIVRGWLARRQLRCLRLLQVTAPYLNTAPGTTKNACGSGKSGESQSILSHLRGGGSETQDGK